MAMIQCPECGQRISDAAKHCPHCGYPLQSKTKLRVTIEKDIQEETATIEKVTKKVNAYKINAVSIIAIAIFGGILLAVFLYNTVALTGNDKMAYNLLVEAADSFKDPSSVRIVSGAYSSVFGLSCRISANNSYGARTTSYYDISENGEIEKVLDYIGETSDKYNSRTALDLDKVNRALEKTLSVH